MRILQTIGWIAAHPLSRGRQVNNIARYFAWQLRSRLLSKDFDFAFVNEARLIVRPGMTGATGNYYTGLHEFSDMGFVMHFLRQDDLFVDVGANVGSYTVLAGAGVGCRVEAFEPAPEAYGWLERNVALNEIEGRTKLHKKAVGAARGFVGFTSGLDTTNHISETGTSMVPMVPLDEALATCPALIKIDVEGYEQGVLDGASGWLSCPDLKCLIVETGVSSGAAELLRAKGFQRFRYDPFSRGLSPSGESQLFVRDLIMVHERVTTAAPFRVRGWTI